MSFSLETKQEMVKLPLGKDCCQVAELNALTQCLGAMSLHGGGELRLKYVTDNLLVARRLLMLLKRGLRLQADTVPQHRKRFGGRTETTITLSGEDSRYLLRRIGILKQDERGEDAFQGAPRRVVRRICCRRAFVRGMFLGCGSVSAPGKGYHAEFVVGEEQKAQYLLRVLALCDIEASAFERRGQTVVYVKEAELLVRLLATMGAARAVLSVEEQRAMQSVKRQVNRAVNCDHANMHKQLGAAARQLDAITRVSQLIGLSALPKELEELARLRISHPEVSLEQLGGLSQPPISKSAVQHRMRRLMSAAQGLSAPIPTEVHKEEA